jgi:Fibronectin type III domain
VNVWVASLVMCAAGLLPVAALGQSAAPAPPANLIAVDHDWDDGTRIDLSWTLSSNDSGLQGYVIRKKAGEDSSFTPVEIVAPGTNHFTVTDLIPNHPYLFQVSAVSKDLTESSSAATSVPVSPTMQWFDGTRVWFLVILLVFCGSVMLFIELARRGVSLKVRKIAGLAAIDEAVGRATEMGRSCLFVPGITDLNDMGTIAGMSILARVSKTAAEYNANIEVPTSHSLVMTAAQETVQAAFLEAGRPDSYNSDSIYYVSDEQFAYVAHIQGYMTREKPAACFYMGSFFAESLILAEMGNAIGAIQIAGTGQPAQLPFFVAACDYTLIGEEFFAASAYLSGEPGQIGSLKGQDVGKLIVAGLVIAGVIAETLVVLTHSPGMGAFVDYLTRKVLS